MENIEEVLRKIDLDDLMNKEFCIFCIAYGIPLESALYNPDDMKEGPITSDSKCPHCYDTEEESGRLRLTKEEREYVAKVDELIKKYKIQHLNSIS